jgi:prepilin-type N-terminal cleavage/methylation domain-containing protein
MSRSFSRNADPRRAAGGRKEGGFTLIELMVVVAIIVLAAGLMTPTITDFFKNRQLEGIRGTIGSAFNRARMAAVDHGKSMSLVFFREGARVFDESTKSFDPDDHFNPETSPFADEAVWYVLGFLRKKASPTIPKYRDWEKSQRELRAAPEPGEKKRDNSSETFNIAGMPKLTFNRDGTVVFAGGGDDVPSDQFKLKDHPPENADIMVYQAQNTVVLFVDIRQTGQIRSRIDSTGIPAVRPDESSGESDSAEEFKLDYDARTNNRGGEE